MRFDGVNQSPASKLGDLLELIIDYRGKTPKKLGGDFSQSGIPVISAIHIKRGRIFWSERERFVTKEMFQKWMQDPLKKGDVLLTSEAPLGEVAMVPSDDDLVLSQRLFALRTKSSVLDPKYLMYFLQTEAGQNELRSRSSGSTVVGIKQAELVNIPVPCPPIGQQQVIGDILMTLDEKILENEKVSKTLEGIAQALFQSWFIDFDPVRRKLAGEQPVAMDDETASLFPAKLAESELGLIPAGWEVSTLGRVLSLKKKTVKAGPDTESLPYVPIDQISSKSVYIVSSKPGVEAKTSLVSFNKGDILFGAMRPYFHKVALAAFDGTTRTTTFVLHPKNEEFLAFGLLTLFQEKSVDYATKNAQGTTIPYAVWGNSFENMPIVQPTAQVADAFNKIVLPLLEFGYSLLNQNETLAKIKASLLPRLISGELQIPEEMLAS
jgi:type I restriction enzyme S subunit